MCVTHPVCATQATHTRVPCLQRVRHVLPARHGGCTRVCKELSPCVCVSVMSVSSGCVTHVCDTSHVCDTGGAHVCAVPAMSVACAMCSVCVTQAAHTRVRGAQPMSVCASVARVSSVCLTCVCDTGNAHTCVCHVYGMYDTSHVCNTGSAHAYARSSTCMCVWCV